MKQIGFVLFSFLVFVACDPVFSVKIKNECKNDILIEAYYDKGILETSWRNRSFIPYLDGRNTRFLINRDTVNLIYTYKIAPGEDFYVEGGVGTHPEYWLYNKILILKPDSIILKNKEEIENAFVNSYGRHWEFNIH